MSKRRIATLLALVFLLAACSSWSSSPITPAPSGPTITPVPTPTDFPMCEAPPVSGYCGHSTDWIALSAPTGEMQVLYEDDRGIIYVTTGAREGLPRSDSLWDEAQETINLARSGDMAVYDKNRECFITEVGVVDYEVWHEVCREDRDWCYDSGTKTIGLCLPDCTAIRKWTWGILG